MPVTLPSIGSLQGWSLRTLGVYYPNAAGAKHDGSTDDSTAINRCITLACARPGGKVEFGPGTYMVSSEMAPTSGIEIAGRGSHFGGTVIKAKSGAETINVINANGNGYAVIVKDLCIASTNAKTAGAGISIDNSNNFVIDHILLTDQYDAILVPLTTFSAGGYIHDVHTFASRHRAMSIAPSGTNPCLDLFVSKCRLDNASQPKVGDGLYIGNVSGVWFDQMDVINFSTGVRVKPTSSAYQAHFTSITSDSCNLPFDFDTSGGAADLRLMKLLNCNAAGDNGTAVKIGSGTIAVTWHGGDINRADDAGGGTAFLIQGGTRHKIHGVEFEPGNGGSETYKPVQITGAATHCSVQGCTSATSGALDIGTSLATYLRLIGNDIPGGLSGSAGANCIGRSNIGIADFTT